VIPLQFPFVGQVQIGLSPGIGQTLSQGIACGLDQQGGDAANATMLIYKIFRPEEWSQLQAQGTSDGAPVDIADGYIHFSTAAQVPGTLAKHFAGMQGLMLLACEAGTMAGDLRWEPSRGGDFFPHLYRPLMIADVIWHRTITTTPKGHDTGPLA
jgi:uncharacterized protein (DUF952 family)